jgi:hypothetical protein
MRKAIIILFVCFFIGCSASNNYKFKTPHGKTDADWGTDEQYCLDKAGKVTGFLASTIFALKNINTEKKYEQCLRDLGWIE